MKSSDGKKEEYKKVVVNINGKNFEFTDGHDYYMKTNKFGYKDKFEQLCESLFKKFDEKAIEELDNIKNRQ